MTNEEKDVVKQSYNFLACLMVLLGFVFGKMAENWWWITGVILFAFVQSFRLVYAIGKYNV